ncbi:hypothetical protein KM043_016821 [Ampulex compressa]|nr:hypothetical protein KM043_016821 [Ampulex compressa]
MAGIYLGCTVVLSAIAVYVGYLYYSYVSREGSAKFTENGNKQDSDVTAKLESPIVRIKISRLCREEDDKTCCNRQRSAENFVRSKDSKETWSITQDTSYVPLPARGIIPVKPPRNRRKFPPETSNEQSQDAIKKTNLEDRSAVGRRSSGIQEDGESIGTIRQSENQSQSLAESGVHDAQIVVTTYAQVYARNSVTLSNGVSDRSIKTLCEHDRAEMLNISISPARHSFAIEYSAGLKKNSLLDASTSTKNNFNVIENLRDVSQIVTNDTDLSNTVLIPVDPTSGARRYSRSEMLPDVSEIRLESVNEVSSLKRSIELFRGSSRKHRSESVITTKGKSMNSAKFFENHRVRLNDKFRKTRSEQHQENFFKHLKERVEGRKFSRIFRRNRSVIQQ